MRLKFWFLSALKMLGFIVGASALYGVVMWIQMDDSSIEFLSAMLPVCLILFGAVMLLSMNVGLYKMAISLVLSFGSTRREAQAGLQVFRLLPGFAVSALVILLTMLPGAELLFNMRTMAVISLGVFLLCGAMGAVLGMVNYRFGKMGAVIAGISIAIVGGGLGVLFGLTGADQTWFYPLLSQMPSSWVFLIISAVVYGLVLIPESRFLRNYQVRQ